MLGGKANKINANFLTLRNLFKGITQRFGKDYTKSAYQL